MCNRSCASMRHGRHIEVAQRGPSRYSNTNRGTLGKSNHTLDELHTYPAGLVNTKFKHVNEAVSCERQGVGTTCAAPVLAPLTELTP